MAVDPSLLWGKCTENPGKRYTFPEEIKARLSGSIAKGTVSRLALPRQELFVKFSEAVTNC